ncbi:MAG: cation:dicarboxylase symporter family transporter, partial [Rectinema sp.]|nr:cation:dicarboxylase symporter family transporter [Rectinema sp.]
MKLWLKYAFGIIVGAILFLAFPPSMAKGTALISFLSEIALRIGSYALVLSLAAGIPGAVFHLSEAKQMSRLAGFAIAISLISLLAFAAIGTIVGTLAKPAPLLPAAEASAAPLPSIEEFAYGVFPRSALSVFSQSENWILPLFVFMFAFGMAIAHDPVMSRPLIPVMDVISRASYMINTFLSEILGILLIPITLQTLVLLRATLISAEYRKLLLLVLMLTLVCLAGIFPLLYRLLGGRKNPYLLLYAMSGPLLATAFSGSLFFAGGTALKHLSESLGVKRNANSLAFPIVFIAGRPGT